MASSSNSGTYNQGSAGAVTESITAKLQQSISVKDFGAVGDGAHLAADTAGIAAAVAAAASAGRAVYMPAGNYLLNNSVAAVLSGAQNVLIYGDGPSSSLACQTIGSNDCIASTGATGFGLKNLAISFGPAATTRTSGYAVDIQSCTNCTFEGLTLNNGDLSGMRLASSVHTQIHNLSISNFYANGLFAINNQDLRVDGEACYNNQDACFETSWYDSQYASYGIPCQNITASNITSNSDTETILINSCNNVTVDGFARSTRGEKQFLSGRTLPPRRRFGQTGSPSPMERSMGAGMGRMPRTRQLPRHFMSTWARARERASSRTSPSTNIVCHPYQRILGLQMAELQNDDVQASNLQFYDVGNGNNTGACRPKATR